MNFRPHFLRELFERVVPAIKIVLLDILYEVNHFVMSAVTEAKEKEQGNIRETARDNGRRGGGRVKGKACGEK